MRLIDVSVFCRDFFALINLMLGIGSCVLIGFGIRLKSMVHGVVGGSVLIISYLMIIFFSYAGEAATYGRVNRQLLFWIRLPFWLYVFLILSLSLILIYQLKGAIRWKKTHVSVDSIKESIDHLPSGVAIYEENGKCLLVNERMNLLSSALCGHAAMNGKELLETVKGTNMTAELDGRRYAFRSGQLLFGGILVHELIADDVTELYRKAEELKKGNERLTELADKMKQYGLTIDDTVRRQEILQAKVHIHDEMNHLLLATGHAASGAYSQEQLKKILETWKNNALLLAREADAQPQSNTMHDLDTLAQLIGISISWEGDLMTEEPKVLKLFELVSREAMTNAVKHAGATKIRGIIAQREDFLQVTYTNDGTKPDREIVPAGGLGNLGRMLEQSGGSLQIACSPEYSMTAKIPLR